MNSLIADRPPRTEVIQKHECSAALEFLTK
jgi:hypothetical protein